MKKTKILSGIVATGVLGGLSAPLVTSCTTSGSSKDLNLNIVENEHIQTKALQAKLNETLILQYTLDDEYELADIYIKVGDQQVQSSNIMHDETNHKISVKAVAITDTKVTVDIRANVIYSLKKIEVTHKPTKKSYHYGESLNLDGMVLTGYYSDGTTSQITNFTTSPAASEPINQIGIVTVYVVAEGKKTSFEINVDNPVHHITIASTPSKVDFKYGDTLDLSGMEVDAVFYDGSTQPVYDYTTNPASGSKLETIGNDQPVQVSYESNNETFTETFKINVSNYVKKVEVTAPTTNTYKLGETIDLTGLAVTAVYADGTTEPITSGYTVYCPDKTTEIVSGTTEVSTDNGFAVGPNECHVIGTFQSKDYDSTFNINANDIIEEIVITQGPTKLQYNFGESLDLTGLEVTAIYKSGARSLINNYSVLCPKDQSVVKTGAIVDKTILNNITDGDTSWQDNIFTVRYTVDGINYDKTLTLQVRDYVTGIERDTSLTPTTTYTYADSFSAANIRINKVYKTEYKQETTDWKIYNVVNGNEVKDGDQINTTNFKDGENNLIIKTTVDPIKSTTFTITVNDEIDTITAADTHGVYTYGDVIDFSGVTLTANWKSGRTTEITNYTAASPTGVALTSGVTPVSKANGFTQALKNKTAQTETIKFATTVGTKEYTDIALNISVKDNYDGLTVTYNQGENYYYLGVSKWDTTDLTVKLVWKSLEEASDLSLTYKRGSTTLTSGTTVMTTSNGFAVGANTISIHDATYNLDSSYSMNVTDAVKQINVTWPTSLVFNIGDTIDYDGLAVEAEYYSTAKQELTEGTEALQYKVCDPKGNTMTNHSTVVSTDNGFAVGTTNTIKVSYTDTLGTEHTATTNVTVKNPAVSLTVSVTQSTGTGDYIFAGQINKSDFSVTPKYKDGSTGSKLAVSNFKVYIYSLEGEEVELTGEEGEISLDNGFVGAGSTDATENKVLVKATLDDKSGVGQTTVSAWTKINIKDKVYEVYGEDSFAKKTYYLGENFTTTGWSLWEEYYSGHLKTLTSSQYTLTATTMSGTATIAEGDALTTSNCKYSITDTVPVTSVTITSTAPSSQGMEATEKQEFQVFDYATGLAASGGKTNFWTGDTFSEGALQVSRTAKGTSAEQITKGSSTEYDTYSLSSPDMSSKGTKTVTVTYNGYKGPTGTAATTTYSINVCDLLSASIASPTAACSVSSAVKDETNTLNGTVDGSEVSYTTAATYASHPSKMTVTVTCDKGGTITPGETIFSDLGYIQDEIATITWTWTLNGVSKSVTYDVQLTA